MIIDIFSHYISPRVSIMMAGIPGLSVETFAFENGRVRFVGTLPDTARLK